MSASSRAGFRNRSARALYEMHYGPNMTPMVDVVMVILIFFMASAAILGPEWFVGARLPKTDASAPRQTTPPLRIRVSLSRDAREQPLATLDAGGPIPLAQLAQALTRARGERNAGDVVVIIDPAQTSRYDDVIAAHVACAEAGLSKVGLGEPVPSAPELP